MRQRTRRLCGHGEQTTSTALIQKKGKKQRKDEAEICNYHGANKVADTRDAQLIKLAG